MQEESAIAGNHCSVGRAREGQGGPGRAGLGLREQLSGEFSSVSSILRFQDSLIDFGPSGGHSQRSLRARRTLRDSLTASCWLPWSGWISSFPCCTYPPAFLPFPSLPFPLLSVWIQSFRVQRLATCVITLPSSSQALQITLRKPTWFLAFSH